MFAKLKFWARNTALAIFALFCFSVVGAGLLLLASPLILKWLPPASPQTTAPAPPLSEVAQGHAHDEKGLHQAQDAEAAEPQSTAHPDQPAAPPLLPSAASGVAAPTQPHVVAPGPQRDAGRGQDKGQKGAEAKKWFDELHGSDWIQIVNNLCLIVANIALFWATWRTAKSAQTSADAALRQVEVMASAEAPVVRVTNIRIGGQGLSDSNLRPKIPDGPFLIVDLVNRGRTPAAVVAFGFDKVVRNGPPDAVSEAPSRDVMRDIFLLPTDSIEIAEPFDLSGEERRHIMIAHEHLWIWGFVDFEDNRGTIRRHRFFVRTDIDVNQENTLFRFLPLRPPLLQV